MQKSRIKYWREYRRKNVSRKLEIERKSRQRPDVKARRKKYTREYLIKNRERIRERRAKDKEKNRSRSKMRDAIKSGKLVRLPCEVCGDINSQGHHTDYSKPLDVKWLCRTHHMMEHRKY